MTGDGSNSYGAGGGGDVPVDYGNGIADINPDDIASIQVLKGKSYRSCFISRAANGVMLVTTKSNKKKYLGSDFLIPTPVSTGYYTGLNFRKNTVKGDLKTNASGKLYHSYGDSEDGAASGNVAFRSLNWTVRSIINTTPKPATDGTVGTPMGGKRNHRKKHSGKQVIHSSTVLRSTVRRKKAVRLSLTYTKKMSGSCRTRVLTGSPYRAPSKPGNR